MYLSAFLNLDTDRDSTFSGFAYIRWETLLKYAEWIELDREETEEFISIMRAVDNAMVRHRHQELP